MLIKLTRERLGGNLVTHIEWSARDNKIDKILGNISVSGGMKCDRVCTRGLYY